MADLGELRELYEWMRERNVLYARSGELELRLGPSPLPVQDRAVHTSPPDANSPVDDDEERHSLETLLHSSGADVEPFLRAMRRSRAA